MEPKIVLLNGPAGVGKTTVGRALAATSSNGVCIHGDNLKHFIVTRQLDQVATGLAYKNAATLARNFAEGGYELIVVEFVFEHPHHVARFCAELEDDSLPIHLFTLWAPLDTVVARERARSEIPDSGRSPLGQQVTDCYRTMAQNLESLGTVIHNLERSPGSLAQMIAHNVTLGIGLIENASH